MKQTKPKQVKKFTPAKLPPASKVSPKDQRYNTYKKNGKKQVYEIM